MPRTGNLTTVEQIQRIRDGLLPPRALFATIEELFESSRTERIDHRAASRNGPKDGQKKRKWTCDGQTLVEAPTKSEARSLWARENGKIPRGTRFYEVK